MRRVIILFLALSLLLGGCGVTKGKLLSSESEPIYDASWELLYKVFVPIASGQLGLDGDNVSAFLAQQCYAYIWDEETFVTEDPQHQHSYICGQLTSRNGTVEITNVLYLFYKNATYYCAGVFWDGPGVQNPSYRIYTDYFNDIYREVSSVEEIVAYLKSLAN